MPLFHPRVIEKHIQAYNAIPSAHLEILQSWAENLESGIYNSETKNDGQFIQRILVDVLGYTESSAGKNWTATKNHPLPSGGNVDVALGSFSADSTQILAPFELKGAKTRDLDAIMAGRNKSPVQQAWEYAMDAKGAKWVLVSNYREIRLYAVGYGRKDYEKFELNQLTQPAHYAKFMLLLSDDNLLGERTANLLKESENKDKEITNKLYQDYKTLRARMIDTLTKENTSVPVLDIIQYTQTILDRILFVAFAEDRGLLPDNTLKSCYEDKAKWNPQPAWENFKGLFHSIDKGNPPLKIPGYNGGLFAHNDAISNLKVSDELCEGFKILGSYDFDSEVSVNILGHIFEQSISDLEEIKANINGQADAQDKKKSKRKKDGIFYTPAYITRYIVEQAVGGWLNDRKQEIGFDKLPTLEDADYASIKIQKGKVSANAKVTKHIKAWEAYKEVLSNIKVLDPACGSGAFLNEVFDYLYREGQTINSELTTLNGNQQHLFRWDKHILANNIYGVDINQESVEITKLSLWLKTANRNEKLTYLDDNIKCGNSLIDDPAIAGDLAFNWQDKFPEIMKSGGFDVVVGNPPYGASLSENEKELFKAVFHYVHMRVQDTFNYFIARTFGLIKRNAYVSYIVPSNLLFQLEYEKTRRYLIENHKLVSAANLGDGVFSSADVPSCIFVVKNETSKDYLLSFVDYRNCQNLSTLDEQKPEIVKSCDVLSNPAAVIGISNKSSQIYSKLQNTEQKPLGDLCKDISYGACTGGDKIFRLSQSEINSKNIEHDILRPVIVGGEIKRYCIEQTNHLLIYTTKSLSIENHPKTHEHLLPHKSKLETKRETKKGTLPWWSLWWPRNSELFEGTKLILRQTGDKIIASIDFENNFTLDSVMIIKLSDSSANNTLFVLTLLNSKLFNFIYGVLSQEEGRAFAQVKPQNIRKLPVARVATAQQRPFIEKAEIMLVKNKELHEVSSKFLALLKSEFGLDKPSTKLEQWYTLDFAEFTKELAKKKITPTLAQKAEWMEHFEKQKFIAAAIKQTIDSTDREIDQMVYTLYNLTPAEIQIVEGAA